jgi:DNA-binding NarL/FixJ family response regulator
VAIGQRFGEKDLLSFARSLQARILLDRGELVKGLALMDEIMVACSAGELSPVITGLIYCVAIESCHSAYALDRAREWTNTFSRWCATQPQLVPFAGTCLVLRAEILQFEGDWSAAMEEARRAARPNSSTPLPINAQALYQEAEIHRLRGEHAAAEEAYRAADDKGRDPQPGLALLRLAQGRADVALTAIRRVLAGAARPLDRARLLPAFVEIALSSRDLPGARLGAEELATIAASCNMDVLDAMAAHARGAVALAEGDAHGALAALRRAFELWQQAGAPYLAARVRVSMARACRALGDHEGAELGLSAARHVFEQLGAAADLAALVPEGVMPVAEHGLTARELEVLRHLATGMTNKAIAQELCLSEKTVDRHVSNIFTKVDVTSRAGATAFAYEKGIVRPAPGAAREPRG